MARFTTSKGKAYDKKYVGKRNVTRGKKFRLKKKGHRFDGRIVQYQYLNKDKKTRKLVLAKRR